MNSNNCSSLKMASLTLVGLLSLIPPSSNQFTSAKAADEANGIVKAGTVFYAKLQNKITTGKNQSLDRFTLKEYTPLFGGNPLLKGAIIEGHLEDVTKAQRGKKASLHIVFDDIILKNKQTLPLDATLVNTKLEKQTQGTFFRNAAILAAGAVAGHYLGKAVGTPNGTGVVSAAAFILTSPGGEVVINKGTEFKIKLNNDLIIPK